MKRTCTLFALSLLAMMTFAQNALTPHHKLYFRDVNGPKPPSVTRHHNNSAARTSAICDTADFLDYSTYNEVIANNTGLNFNGSWNSSSPSILAEELSSFVDTAHAFDLRYVMGAFDSIAFADLQSGSTAYYPLSKSTIYVDSLGLFIGVFGDTTVAGGKMAHDSIVFTVYPITNNSIGATPTKTVVYTGYAGLEPFFKGEGYLGYTQVGIGAQMNHGEGFAIRMDYLNKDTSSHCIFSYTYADSCGTITYMGNQYTSPAYPSPFVGRSLWGLIQQSGTSANATVANQNSGFAYNLSGVPQNCSFVYDQNWEMLPIINVCVDYSTKIQTASTKACPGASVDLNALAFGTNSSNLNFIWAATNGTLTSNSGQTTTVVMGSSGNCTVTLTTDDGGGNFAYDTLVLTNNGININITNSAPIQLGCGDSVRIITSITGITAGKSYTWSTGATGANVATQWIYTPGTYKVTVTNNAGCSASASIDAQYSSGATNVANFTVPNPPVCVNRQVTFTNTSTYQQGWNATWDMGNGDQVLTTNAQYTYASPGVFTVKLTMDSAGCSFASPTHTVTVLSATNAACISGIEDVTFANAISMLPNPSNGNLEIVVNGVEKNLSIHVYNILGSEVKSFNVNDAPSVFTRNFDFSTLANGTYLVKIQTGDKAAVKRLTISK